MSRKVVWTGGPLECGLYNVYAIHKLELKDMLNSDEFFVADMGNMYQNILTSKPELRAGHETYGQRRKQFKLLAHSFCHAAYMH